jgi:methylenetetrahydrofolate dehydrogenase (NADP+)/methenyltetrahydrofolate cyclohydrolase
VTVCHSKTRNLAAVCREADILVAAIGRPGMITADYVKSGAAVIDVGTTPIDGRVVGDVDRASVEPVAGWLTPVPGGVGPMTVAMLLRNTLALARARRRVGIA